MIKSPSHNAWCVYFDESETICKVHSMDDVFDKDYCSIAAGYALTGTDGTMSCAKDYVLAFIHAETAADAEAAARPIAHRYIMTEHPFWPAYSLTFDRKTREMRDLVPWAAKNSVTKSSVCTCSRDDGKPIILVELHAVNMASAKSRAYNMLKDFFA